MVSLKFLGWNDSVRLGSLQTEIGSEDLAKTQREW